MILRERSEPTHTRAVDHSDCRLGWEGRKTQAIGAWANRRYIYWRRANCLNIIVSYPSVHRSIAERVKLALEAEGHDVFFDRDDLPSGEAYHQAIRKAIDAADLFVFLISPEAVAPGSYTLAELRHAERRWPRAAGRVLPVLVAPTPRANIPPYLLSVTLLEAQGDLVAETVARVAEIASPRRRARRMAAASAIAGLIVVGGGVHGLAGAGPPECGRTPV